MFSDERWCYFYVIMSLAPISSHSLSPKVPVKIKKYITCLFLAFYFDLIERGGWMDGFLVLNRVIDLPIRARVLWKWGGHKLLLMLKERKCCQQWLWRQIHQILNQSPWMQNMNIFYSREKYDSFSCICFNAFLNCPFAWKAFSLKAVVYHFLLAKFF